MTEISSHISHRSPRLDALRGIAVLGMITAHALFFFHTHTDPFLVDIEKLLNTTIFTIFLFISGLSLSRFLDKETHTSNKLFAGKVLKRTGVLYAGYALTAIIALLTTIPLVPQSILTGFIRAITLFSPPNFTEYLPLFILISFSTIPLRVLFRWTRQSLLLTILIGAFSYTLGLLLYPITLPPILNEIKQLFAGGQQVLRFPAFFYFPVFLLGIWWQHFTDHVVQDKKTTAIRLAVTLTATGITMASALLASRFYIPMLDASIRWPPSLAFLAAGLTAACAGVFILPSLRFLGDIPKRIVVYFGRDAFDLWISHLLILFLYRGIIGIQFENIVTVAMAIVLLIAAASLMSAVTITNTVAFPLKFAMVGTTKFRRRYILIAFFSILALIWTMSQPGERKAPYGSSLIAPALTIGQKLPVDAAVKLTSDKTWYAKHSNSTQSVDLSVLVSSDKKALSINPDLIQIKLGDKVQKIQGKQTDDGVIHFSLLTDTLSPGRYGITASADTGKLITSNSVDIVITEPLMIAWTFDWEGWDASNSAMTTMNSFDIPLSHFVSPRTFLPGVLSPERSMLLQSFLLARHAKGDTLGMHLHMHYDFVRAAGLTPATSPHWGLLSDEGYDVPTTRYTSEEFSRLVTYGQQLFHQLGFPQMKGYRAGGWYISRNQLSVLSQLGFLYDSSARDKPAFGAFKATPWNAPVGTDPYYPDVSDQNLASDKPTDIFEIPDAGTTFDLTTKQILDRVNQIYTTGYLRAPKALVFVSHPQFSGREFHKIQPVIQYLKTISVTNDSGPVTFVTTDDMYDIWRLLY